MVIFNPRKNLLNIKDHKISLARFDDMLPESMVVFADDEHSIDEKRYAVLGLIDGALYYASFVYRDGIERIISLREATKREHTIYGKTIRQTD